MKKVYCYNCRYLEEVPIEPSGFSHKCNCQFAPLIDYYYYPLKESRPDILNGYNDCKLFMEKSK
jgi:hypothetical protein